MLPAAVRCPTRSWTVHLSHQVGAVHWSSGRVSRKLAQRAPLGVHHGQELGLGARARAPCGPAPVSPSASSPVDAGPPAGRHFGIAKLDDDRIARQVASVDARHAGRATAPRGAHVAGPPRDPGADLGPRAPRRRDRGRLRRHRADGLAAPVGAPRRRARHHDGPRAISGATAPGRTCCAACTAPSPAPRAVDAGRRPPRARRSPTPRRAPWSSPGSTSRPTRRRPSGPSPMATSTRGGWACRCASTTGGSSCTLEWGTRVRGRLRGRRASRT